MKRFIKVVEEVSIVKDDEKSVASETESWESMPRVTLYAGIVDKECWGLTNFIKKLFCC